MWHRGDIKYYAKVSLKANYWGPFLVCLIVTLLGSNLFETKYTQGFHWMESLRITSNIFQFHIPYFPGIHLYGIFLFFASICFRLFVINPLNVGKATYFLNHAHGKEGISDFGCIFIDMNYWNVVKIMFLKDLKIFLWTLCFILPGIIKAMQYSMIPYLLAEQSNQSYADAFSTSKQLTYQELGNIFVFGLSFLGWYFLGGLIWIGSYFVHPYYEASYAQLFTTLKQHHGVY